MPAAKRSPDRFDAALFEDFEDEWGEVEAQFTISRQALQGAVEGCEHVALPVRQFSDAEDGLLAGVGDGRPLARDDLIRDEQVAAETTDDRAGCTARGRGKAVGADASGRGLRRR